MSIIAQDQLQHALTALYPGDDSSSLVMDKLSASISTDSDSSVLKSKTDSLGRSSIVGGLLGKLERLTILIGSDQDPIPKTTAAGSDTNEGGSAAVAADAPDSMVEARENGFAIAAAENAVESPLSVPEQSSCGQPEAAAEAIIAMEPGPYENRGADEGIQASLQMFESVLQEVVMQAIRENGSVTPAAPLADQPLADFLLEEELLWITGGLAAAVAANAAAASQSYVTGDIVSEGECGVCFSLASTVEVRQRPCCRLTVCQPCLGVYFAMRVTEGCTALRCPGESCDSPVAKDEIMDSLSPELRLRYTRIIQNANCSPFAKTCPHCCHMTTVDAPALGTAAVKRGGLKLSCSACNFLWCFSCHAPWHEGISCSQYREGDRALRLWAKEKHYGQLNARRCPKCKVLIQRIAGCDHIHCKQCETDFCYRCGRRHVRVRFIGDHYDPLSILGCPYAFMGGKQRHLRRFVRGSIFTGQVLAVPVGVALAVGLLPVALAAAAIAGPVLGFMRLHRYLQQRKHASKKRSKRTSKTS